MLNITFLRVKRRVDTVSYHCSTGHLSSHPFQRIHLEKLWNFASGRASCFSFETVMCCIYISRLNESCADTWCCAQLALGETVASCSNYIYLLPHNLLQPMRCTFRVTQCFWNNNGRTLCVYHCISDFYALGEARKCWRGGVSSLQTHITIRCLCVELCRVTPHDLHSIPRCRMHLDTQTCTQTQQGPATAHYCRLKWSAAYTLGLNG